MWQGVCVCMCVIRPLHKPHKVPSEMIYNHDPLLGRGGGHPGSRITEWKHSVHGSRVLTITIQHGELAGQGG